MIYRGTIFLELISISDDTYEMIAVEDVSLRGVVALNNLFDLCGNETNQPTMCIDNIDISML